MRDTDRQPDLFAEPAPAPGAARPLRPPYSLAELEALDRQLRTFDRIPDTWCADWWEIYERAHDTLLQVTREERTALRAVYFEQANRLLRIEWAAEAADEAAARAKAQPAAHRRSPRRTPGAASGG